MGCPKIVIIQACRGNKNSFHGRVSTGDSAGPVLEDIIETARDFKVNFHLSENLIALVVQQW